jgi:microcystin-dependent protein
MIGRSSNCARPSLCLFLLKTGLAAGREWRCNGRVHAGGDRGGQGQGPGLPGYKQGQKGGVTSATLSVAQMPVHSHGATTTVTVDSTLKGTSGAADSPDPSGRALATAH